MMMAGCSKPRYSLDDRDQLCNELTKFFVIDRCRTAYEWFLDGIRSLGLLEEIQKHPSLFKPCFLRCNAPLTAQTIEQLFPYELSPEGSNRRRMEADVATFWLDFLLDVQDKQSPLTLENILIFATASDRIPPAGFDCTPALRFIHDKEPNETEISKFPKAHTCTGVLMLPIHPSYQLFKEKMEFGILSSPDFGFA